MKNEDALRMFSEMRQVNGALHHRMAIIFEDAQLKGYHTMFLFSIAENRGVTAKELSEMLDVDKGHTSRALNELQALGYITREAWGRSAAIDISPKGEELLERIKTFFDEICADVSGKISSEQWREFTGVLAVIKATLLEGMPPRRRHHHHGREEE